MKLLITGAAGFIGSHIANWYARNGHDVVGLDNYEYAGSFSLDSRIRMVWGDIRQCKVVNTIADIKPDLISHHAARIDPRDSMKDPVEDAKANYIGTINVVEGALKAECEQLIFASSCAVYGDIGVASMMVEGQFELPNCPYGVSKLASEKYIRIAMQTRGLRAAILRYPNVYGPAQSGTRSTGVVAIFAHEMARGRPITVYGDGTARYQYCYINDIVDANRAAEKWLKDLKHSFIVTNIIGRMVSVNDLAAMIATHFDDYELRMNYEKPRDGEQHDITMREDAAESELGWKPTINIREGIARVVEAAKAQAAKDATATDLDS